LVEEAAMGEASRDAPAGDHRHILAINDDAMVLDLFRDLLEDEGYRVSTQLFLDKDLAAIADMAPDLIILDYMWPTDDTGWSLLQMLRMEPQTAHIPIVLCTGAVREVEGMAGHLAEMAVRVVFKPFNIDQLIDEVRAALAEPPHAG
jgi:CheY-like chemotaxis protein